MMLTSQENTKTEHSVQNSNANQHMQMHEHKLFHNSPQYYYTGFPLLSPMKYSLDLLQTMNAWNPNANK